MADATRHAERLDPALLDLTRHHAEAVGAARQRLALSEQQERHATARRQAAQQALAESMIARQAHAEYLSQRYALKADRLTADGEILRAEAQRPAAPTPAEHPAAEGCDCGCPVDHPRDLAHRHVFRSFEKRTRCGDCATAAEAQREAGG